MANLLQANSDYILFVQSVAMLLLALQGWFLARADTGFRWLWLGAFFLAQTVNVWLDILSLSGFVWEGTPLVQGAIQLASFLSLAELARSSAHPIRRFKPGIWIHIPLIAAALLLNRLAPDHTLRASAAYALALPCGAWFGILLWKSGRQHPFRQARALLRQAALVMTIYTLALVLSTPSSASLSLASEGTGLDAVIQTA
ncbi:MAG: hypothetical protein WC378_08475, partial [Opitutaceae bacterium]